MACVSMISIISFNCFFSNNDLILCDNIYNNLRNRWINDYTNINCMDGLLDSLFTIVIIIEEHKKGNRGNLEDQK